MKSFIERAGDLTCGQALAISVSFNIIFIVISALFYFQPTY